MGIPSHTPPPFQLERATLLLDVDICFVCIIWTLRFGLLQEYLAVHV